MKRWNAGEREKQGQQLTAKKKKKKTDDGLRVGVRPAGFELLRLSVPGHATETVPLYIYNILFFFSFLLQQLRI